VTKSCVLCPILSTMVTFAHKQVGSTGFRRAPPLSVSITLNLSQQRFPSLDTFLMIDPQRWRYVVMPSSKVSRVSTRTSGTYAKIVRLKGDNFHVGQIGAIGVSLQASKDTAAPTQPLFQTASDTYVSEGTLNLYLSAYLFTENGQRYATLMVSLPRCGHDPSPVLSKEEWSIGTMRLSTRGGTP
jgi:hypothetical protein